MNDRMEGQIGVQCGGLMRPHDLGPMQPAPWMALFSEPLLHGRECRRCGVWFLDGGNEKARIKIEAM